MQGLRADFRDAIRSLTGRPTLTLTLVLTLALGVGAITTVSSFAYALLLRPYPYNAPEALIQVQSVYTREGGARHGMSLRDLDDYRQRTTTVAAMGAHRVFDMRLLTDGPPAVLSTALVNADTLSLLGVAPIMGRLFVRAEDRPGGDVNRAIISYELWHSLFGGDPAVIGKPLRSDRRTYTIVGVMPADFAFPDRVSVWMPLESWYSNLPANDGRRQKWRGTRRYETVARLNPGITIAEAQADLDGIAVALEHDYPRDNDGIRIVLTPLREFEMGAIRPYLLMCVGGVAFVMLICCANVASLLLVRVSERLREVALRSALGASRWRIARPLLVENLLLHLAGVVVGLGVGWLGVRGLLTLIPVPLPAWMQIEVDAPVFLFAILAGGLTSIVVGVAPLVIATGRNQASGLREHTRMTTRQSVRSALVVTEIALAVVLLVGAGLLMQTFLRLERNHPGFESENVAVARIVMWVAGTRTEAAAVVNGIHTRVLERLSALPGVRSAALTNYLPYSSSTTDRLKADMFIKGRADELIHTLGSISGAEVSLDYFTTMHIPLIRGRLFESTDTSESRVVAVISERAAKLFWPNQDPIGQEIAWNKPTEANPWRTVIGIVGNVKHHAAEGEVGFELYHTASQWPAGTGYYVVRTGNAPDAMLETIRRTIVETEPTIAVGLVKTLERTVTESLWQRRLWAVLFTAFATLALALAALGVYGVISYSVAQRTKEIGVRMALGSTPGEVRWLVVRDAMKLCVIGVAGGSCGALMLWRIASSLLFGVTARDPSSYALMVATIATATLTACWPAALRASRVDPAASLRAV